MCDVCVCDERVTWSSVRIALAMSGSRRQLSMVQTNADMFDTTTNWTAKNRGSRGEGKPAHVGRRTAQS